jgi:hypothetical protein
MIAHIAAALKHKFPDHGCAWFLNRLELTGEILLRPIRNLAGLPIVANLLVLQVSSRLIEMRARRGRPPG